MAVSYAGERGRVSGWPFAVDGWRWIVWWPGLQATNGTYTTYETYGARRSKPPTANCQLPTANRQPPTANRKPLTVALESIMERNLVEAIDPDAEIIDQAIF
jgi:hypothetical protein